MQDTIEAYPLCWPAGYKRTLPGQRIWSKFKQSYDGAQRFLQAELQRLGARDIITSTNLRMRKDGMLYSDELNRRIDDPGVAIYFKYKGKTVSMCCDQYTKVWENLYALGKGIEALRGMERWGVSEFLDRAFTGFTALPSSLIVPYRKPWYQVLGFAQPPASIDEAEAAYKRLAKERHPDMPGGSTEAFQELGSAYKEALNQY